MEIVVSIGLLIAVLAWVLSVYNRLFHLRNEVRGAWKQWVLATRSRNEQLDDFADSFARALPQDSSAPERLRRLILDSEQMLKKMESSYGGRDAENAVSPAEWQLQRVLHESLDEVEQTPQMQDHLRLQQLCGLLAMALYQQEHRSRLFNRAVQEYNAALVSPGGRTLASVFGFRPFGILKPPPQTRA